MSRVGLQGRYTPSILDRLLDREPDNSREPTSTRVRGIVELKESVRRDLEWLLNTRRATDVVSEGLPEVGASLMTFGLPDYTGTSLKSSIERMRICRIIETAIAHFEPRLQNVSVSVKDSASTDRELNFHILAHLRVEPVPEPVSFDTILQIEKTHYVVKG